MYKTDWFRIDNHELHECFGCGKTFIIGSELLFRSKRKFPICPYCGGENTGWLVMTEDDLLEEFADKIGDLAIHVED